MSNLWFHEGGHPDLFLILCAAVSLGAGVIVTLRARRKRDSQRRKAR